MIRNISGTIAGDAADQEPITRKLQRALRETGPFQMLIVSSHPQAAQEAQFLFQSTFGYFGSILQSGLKWTNVHQRAACCRFDVREWAETRCMP